MDLYITFGRRDLARKEKKVTKEINFPPFGRFLISEKMGNGLIWLDLFWRYTREKFSALFGLIWMESGRVPIKFFPKCQLCPKMVIEQIFNDIYISKIFPFFFNSQTISKSFLFVSHLFFHNSRFLFFLFYPKLPN